METVVVLFTLLLLLLLFTGPDFLILLFIFCDGGAGNVVRFGTIWGEIKGVICSSTRTARGMFMWYGIEGG